MKGRKAEILRNTCVSAWMHVEHITLSKISNKDKYCLLSLMCDIA